MDERPVCDCHGEPMHRWGHLPNGRQRWICGVWNRKRQQEIYYSNEPKHRLYVMKRNMASRRSKALERVAERHTRHAAG